ITVAAASSPLSLITLTQKQSNFSASVLPFSTPPLSASEPLVADVVSHFSLRRRAAFLPTSSRPPILPTSGRPLRRLALLPSPVLLLQSLVLFL
ncbi:hypothetical protein PIB30_079776, partial [Stylosanthes scabra]|nr:hypothetical protein [Stylosanthes scabra]